MLQRLLAERFRLQLHRETRKLPVFALLASGRQTGLSPGGTMAPHQKGSASFMHRDGRVQLRSEGETMSWLADRLANILGRPVADRTGLTGRYTYTLEYLPDSALDAGRPAEPDSPPALAPALRQQLGLRLERRRGPVEVWVVDQAERVPIVD
jgi:uncharacterized protein (TIGR03435 family)